MTDNNASSFEELLARSMEAEPEILPFLPALFADLENLGARADEVVSVLREAGFPTGARVLDLGCGKGAVAIALAKEFGATVRGVDGMPAFLEHAECRSRGEGVDARCVFSLEDIRHTVKTARGYDMVCLLALGDLFGTARETVGVLRECVRPGGYVMIDDAYLADDVAPIEGLENCFDRDTTLGMLTAHGDDLVGERVVDGPEQLGFYREMMASIERRAAEIAETTPMSTALLRDYVERQKAEVGLLCGPVLGALWLLRRRG